MPHLAHMMFAGVMVLLLSGMVLLMVSVLQSASMAARMHPVTIQAGGFVLQHWLDALSACRLRFRVLKRNRPHCAGTTQYPGTMIMFCIAAGHGRMRRQPPEQELPFQLR